MLIPPANANRARAFETDADVPLVCDRCGWTLNPERFCWRCAAYSRLCLDCGGVARPATRGADGRVRCLDCASFESPATEYADPDEQEA